MNLKVSKKSRGYGLLKTFFLTSLLMVIIVPIYYESMCSAQPSENYISTAGTSSDFPIVDGSAAAIYVASDDERGVARAVKDLQADINRVTGKTPVIINNISDASGNTIIVGTIGKSTVLDNLISSGKIDVTAIKGKWESTIIQVVENPVDGVSRGLVIAGSDRRGTIYGIYDLSEKMGVSPWYYWADVPSKTKSSVYVKQGIYKQGEPSVKYRGIFLNNEAPCLSGWTKEKFGGVGFNHLFYEKVFELILRLKGNYLWPAMWGNSFNQDDTQNPVLADQYGIVMGTSHHEPMMRAQKEWTDGGVGEWNHVTNRTNLNNFWDFGIQRNKNYDNLITIGMRGDGDMAMPGNTIQEQMSALKTVIADQRDILTKRVNADLTKVPQLWALYTEVQEYYQNGFRVADDVTYLWTDDNYGNVRMLPTANERNRAGGSGIYYHIDANVYPYIYKWINTIPITKIWEQMNMSYQHEADRVWIVNVGDIKPLEFPLEFFMRLAWDVNKFNKDNLLEYAVSWATEQFGSTYAADIADIIMKYSKFNGRIKPEKILQATYHVTNYNEGERVLDEWKSIADKCEKIYGQIPSEYRDAYYQLVYYPTIQSKGVMAMQYYAAMSNLYAGQGRAMTNDYANLTKTTFDADAAASNYYNKTMLNGKWNHTMDQPHIGFPGAAWDDPKVDKMPTTKTITIGSGSEMGVAIEGSATTWPNSASCTLPDFSVYTKDRHFIEIFNKKSSPFSFTITTDKSWIKLDSIKGTVNKQTRVWVDIDWSTIPKGADVTGQLTVSNGASTTVPVKVKVVNPASPDPATIIGFIENNGYVSMEAEHYTKKVDAGGVKWEEIPDYGRTGSSMALFPSTGNSVKPPQGSPCLEYQFYLFNSGTYAVSTYTAPTCAFDPNHGISYAVSIDDQTPQTVQNYPSGNSVNHKDFNTAIKDNILIRNTSFKFNASGYHTLKVWMVDPGVVLQKIVINTGGLQPSFLGPPESYFGVDKTTANRHTAGSKKIAAGSQFNVRYNRFSSQLVIKYALQQNDQQVEVNMYTLQGKRVATIMKGMMGGEPATFLWDANNVSSGSYICRIAVDGRNSWTRQIVVSK